MTSILADSFRAVRNALAPVATSIPISIPSSMSGQPLRSDSNYAAHARAYTTNEVVSAAVNLLATSAAEPQIIGRRWQKGKSGYAQMRHMAASRHSGFQARIRNQYLVQNGFVEEIPQHPLVRLLNNPNPHTTRGRFMQNLVMDRCIDGNAYVFKARGSLGQVAELWRLRPDRVRIIPDRQNYIAGYVYTVGNESWVYPAEDVIHFQELNPLNDYYGMSPLDPIMQRIDIDNALRSFLGGYYVSGGSGPGAILTVSGKLSDTAKTEIRDRLRRLMSGHSAMHETLILDQGQSSYERLGLDRGLAAAVPKDVNSMNEARLAMPFGIPGSILGLLIGYESSSYANKRADWQVLWDVKMTPMMSDFDDGFTQSFCQPLPGEKTPEFAGIDEVQFDLGDIRALQEDRDALEDRHRKNVGAGIESLQEGRAAIGLDPELTEGTFFVPTNLAITPVDRLDGVMDEGGDVQALALNGAQIASLLSVLELVTQGQLAPEAAKSLIRVSFPSVTSQEIDAMVDNAASFNPETVPSTSAPDAAATIANALQAMASPVALLEGPRRGRPKLENDAEARALWERGERLRRELPSMTFAQIASRIGISERTYRQYRSTFGE